MNTDLAKKHMTMEGVIDELERRFGPGVVYRLSQARPKVGDLALATGSLGLDRATGIGGVPRGRITEIIGPASSGKTTLAYHLVANAQKDGGLAVFVDAAHSADTEAMARCGVDASELILAVPGTAVEALAMTEILVRSRALDALVFSSLSALFHLPRHNADDGKYLAMRQSGSPVGYLLAQALRKINLSLKGSPTALVFVGTHGRGTSICLFAPEARWNEANTSPRATDFPAHKPVGAALSGRPGRGGAYSSFYASMRIEMSLLRPIFLAGGDVGGLRVRARVLKSRFNPAAAVAEFDILEERGIHREAELFDLGYALGMITRPSLGFVFQQEFLGKSRERAIAALEKDRGLAGRLERSMAC